jgi:hypothetical protein
VRRLTLVLVVPLVLALGCDDDSGSGGGRGGGGSSDQASVSVATCRKLVGATLFQVEGLPFTAKYRNAIDSVCENPGLESRSPTDVLAMAELAQQVAEGTTP